MVYLVLSIEGEMSSTYPDETLELTLPWISCPIRKRKECYRIVEI